MSWHPTCPKDARPYVGSTFEPSAIVEHRTIGKWAGDYSVLARGRVPSVHFLVGQEWGQWVQFYSTNKTCAHASGANSWSWGIEFSGQNGEPLTDWQLIAGASIHKWAISKWGPLNIYRGYPQKTNFWRGILNHADVAVPPGGAVRSDYVRPSEVERMIGGNVEEGDPVIAAVNTPSGVFAFVRGSDNSLWFRRSTDGGVTFGPWASGGGEGKLTSSPSVAVHGDKVVVFVRGQGNSLWTRTLNAEPLTWEPWSNLEGKLA